MERRPRSAITAGRRVYARANLTAFSTASVPALKNAAFAGPLNGASASSRSASVDVDLVRDDREVGVEEARGLLLDGLDDVRMRVADVQAADAAGEVENVLPSTSVSVEPRPSAATIGR